MFREEIFTKKEILSFKLREFFSSMGYSLYKMNTFDSYSFYLENIDFLSSKDILYFTDKDGTLMALKPDITLSIIKNIDITKDEHKLYYSENVYRTKRSSNKFKEILQFGVELIGKISDDDIYNLIYLAAKSLRIIDENPVLIISDNNILHKIIEKSGTGRFKDKILQSFKSKNLIALNETLKSEVKETDKKIFNELLSLHMELDKGIERLKEILEDDLFAENIKYLEKLSNYLRKNQLQTKVLIDFSIAEDLNYYDKINFIGMVPKISSEILSGGEYTNLVKARNSKYLAAGFAIYLEKLDLMESLI